MPFGDRVLALRELVEQECVPSLELLLPLLLNLDGKPYTLQNHFPFGPLFRAMMPKQSVWVTGRQLSKSTSIAAHGVILSNAIPRFKTLYVCPLYEQIRRFSNNYVRPFIDQSPVKTLWSGTNTENSVLQRSFKNGSLMIFSFALLDADRIRGVATHSLRIDEVQDMDPDHIPIMSETLSYSKWGLKNFTGTPKTLDGPLAGLHSASSQAEWFIPCRNAGCHVWNIPAPEYHLDAMIGDYHDGISEQCPAVVCYKCRRPINPRFGHWVHRRPKLRWKFAGYHVPQIILPLHYTRPDKWSELLLKREGWGNTTQAMFYNEVLGVSVDAGQKLVTETQLRAACTLPWKNNPKQPAGQIQKLLKHYKHRCLAIDWGGGGEEGVSFTALAVLGYRENGQVDVLWGKRLLLGSDHLKEAIECMRWYRAFKCDSVAHDYTGAGTVRETVMVQAGFALDKIIPVKLVRAAIQDLMTYKAPTPINHRHYYSLDKTRSLNYTCMAIKLKQIRFFEYDHIDDDNRGLISDFLALVENKTETRLAGDIYTITRNTMLSDDFAQAVNIGASAMWHMHKSWPNFAQLAGLFKISPEQVLAAGNVDYGWENDQTERFFGMP